MTDQPTRPSDDPSLGLELATLIEHRRELLVVLDDDARVSWLGPAARQWFGGAEPGTALTDLAHPDDATTLRAVLVELMAGGATVGEARCRLRHHDDSWRTLELSITDRRGRAGVAGLVCIARDPADRLEVTARLIHRATHDTLTALPNRASLLDTLNAPAPPGEGSSIGVLYLDLDGFKEVNDTLGHAAGDRVLVTVADRLRRAVRPGDTVARMGGDEFVVVARGVSDGAVASEIARRIVAGLAEPIAVGGRTVRLGGSVGAAVGPRQRAMELLEEADQAMYEAKRQGKSGCVLFSAAAGRSAGRLPRAESILRDALEGDGVSVLYQPVVALGANRLAGVDAALRLRDGHGRLVVPGSLLEVAEDTGLSVALGAGLLDIACEQMAAWRRDRGARGVLTDTLLGVPLSARQLADPHAAERVTASLARHELDPSLLCLSVPETTLVDADSAVSRSLQKVKALGVRLAVDDFGAGRSSLPYLRRFGVDMLRLEPRFVAALVATGTGAGEPTVGDPGTADDPWEPGRPARPGPERSPADSVAVGTGGQVADDERDVLAALVGLGERLGLTVIAKGVSTALHVAVLEQLGCPLATGPYFGDATRVARAPRAG